MASRSLKLLGGFDRKPVTSGVLSPGYYFLADTVAWAAQVQKNHTATNAAFSQRHLTSARCLWVLLCLRWKLLFQRKYCKSCMLSLSTPRPNVVHLFVVLLASVCCWYRLVKFVFSVSVAYLSLVLAIRFTVVNKNFLLLKKIAVVAENKLLQSKSYCCRQMAALGHRMILL